MGALPGQVDEVGEGHPAEADVEDRVRGAGLDVLFDVAVDRLVGALLDVAPGEARLEVRRHLAHLHRADLVVQGTQRHGCDSRRSPSSRVLEILGFVWSLYSVSANQSNVGSLQK